MSVWFLSVGLGRNQPSHQRPFVFRLHVAGWQALPVGFYCIEIVVCEALLITALVVHYKQVKIAIRV